LEKKKNSKGMLSIIINGNSAEKLHIPPSTMMWFRNRSPRYPLNDGLVGTDFSRRLRSRDEYLPPVVVTAGNSAGVNDTEDDDDGDHYDQQQQQRPLAAANLRAMTILVLSMYALCALCRFGFGWDPIRRGGVVPPPPTYTLHIPGVTDDRFGGSQPILTNAKIGYDLERAFP
jgi:hypothetical protein